MSKLEKFLEWFHDGREDEYNRILKVFGTTRNFLKTVLKYNEQDQVDVTYIPSDEFQNDSELFNFIVDKYSRLLFSALVLILFVFKIVPSLFFNFSTILLIK
jgi:hypothetical protein